MDPVLHPCRCWYWNVLLRRGAQDLLIGVPGEVLFWGFVFEIGFFHILLLLQLSLMLAGKVPTTRDWKKVLLAILQSSVFLGLNGAGFIGTFCVVRNLLRQFNIVSSAFLPSFIANYLAILVERPSRRPALAVYVTNVASETVYNMLVARGIVRPLAHVQVLIFSLTLAALFRWFRTNRQPSSFQHKLLTLV